MTPANENPKIDGNKSAMIECPALFALIAKVLVEKDQKLQQEKSAKMEGDHVSGISTSGFSDNKI